MAVDIDVSKLHFCSFLHLWSDCPDNNQYNNLPREMVKNVRLEIEADNNTTVMSSFYPEKQ